MITNIAGTAAVGTAAADSAMKQATGMDMDSFLTLFVTQLKNQDPLNPQDSSQFVTQLAQISQVQQAYNTNTNLTSLLNQGGNSMTVASVSLIGKQVEASGSQVSLQSGSSAAINFSLAGAANQVNVSVKDSTGATVKTLSGGAMAAGTGSLAWDGTNTAGTALPSGAYSFSVSATDASGKSVTSNPLIRGVVSGVDMSGATPMLNIGNLEINLTDVTSVSSAGG